MKRTGISRNSLFFRGVESLRPETCRFLRLTPPAVLRENSFVRLQAPPAFRAVLSNGREGIIPREPQERILPAIMCAMTQRTMRALGYFPREGQVRPVELPVDPLQEDEILVRIVKVGFTRRDRDLLQDLEAVTPAGSDFIVPGHVAVGKVVRTGDLVRDFQPGDIVVPTVRRDCNRCIDARSDLCPHPEHYSDSGLKGAHGFAREFIAIRSRYLIRIPAHLESLALLLTPLSRAEKAHEEAVQVMKRYNFFCYHNPEDFSPSALIAGMGIVGIMTAFLLSLYNYRLTIFSRREVDDSRSVILKPLNLEYVNTQWVPTERLEKEGCSFNQLFETTGDPEFAFRLFPFLTCNSVAVLMDAPARATRDLEIDVEAGRLLDRMVHGNQVILGSIKAGRDAFESGLRHLSELADLYGESLSNLFTHVFPFDEYRDLLHLDTREAVIPVLEME